MNKRIKKKKDMNRINKKIDEIVELAPMMFHYYLYGNHDGCNEVLFYSTYKYIPYGIWIKTNSCKRCWTYILKKHHIPKHIEYKNKIIRT